MQIHGRRGASPDVADTGGRTAKIKLYRGINREAAVSDAIQLFKRGRSPGNLLVIARQAPIEIKVSVDYGNAVPIEAVAGQEMDASSIRRMALDTDITCHFFGRGHFSPGHEIP